MSKWIIATGFLILIHALYASNQYRNLIKSEPHATEHALPMDIIGECFLALLLCFYGLASRSLSQFKKISKMEVVNAHRVSDVSSGAMLWTFNHRGKLLSDLQRI
eukprot:TRINITY_DN3522_c0_g1_i2.p1 TRINITY_DN3522_c0_g1~~TRINITY_DN3522_c0_g1_i2.p1  ORF type:complete len:105 (-),score=16.88 TRINITY_DN3522_c0_g1_i2:17-331(-)